MSAIYATQARAVGGRDGHAETPDGLLKVDLAMPRELGGNGQGTNPEQLFAAGYAACFESAMRYVARQQKAPLKGAAVTATVELHPHDGGGFSLGVALAAEVEGLDAAAAHELVETAHKVCPYSNAVRGNVDVRLTTTVR
ncbi:MAG: organic hydroperoxide resistance protein, partial [Pseudomonadota bacterium]